MINKTIASVENVSPVKAREWLSYNYKNQRRVNKRRVDFYALQMSSGGWRPTNPISFAYLSRELHLINGQHTLNAVLKSGVTLKSIPIIKYFVDDIQDVNDLYAHQDIGMSRTYADSLKAYDIPQKTGLSMPHLNKLSSAISLMITGFPPRNAGRKLIAHEDMIDLVFEWLNEFRKVREAISPCGQMIRNRIELRSVMSVALLTARYQPDSAFVFWKAVAQANMLKSNDPRNALHKGLLMMGVHGSGGSPNMGYSTGTFSRVAAYCWNKWMGGMSLTYVKPTVADKMNPIIIAGTPYDGKNNPM